MEKKQFQAESKRLLDLMINSIYTHKEIFLREIISNASDAIDKLCYLSLTDDQVGMERGDFEIRIKVDPEARTLTVSDNGIGMNAEELEHNLGVIADSGTFRFRQELEEGKSDAEVIGQFGVGFYSTFMVSDHITVVTRKYGEAGAWRWESEGADGYTVEPAERETVGTDVIMHLKPDPEEDPDEFSRYLREFELRGLVRKYSDYIRFPIRMLAKKSRRVEGSPDDKPEYEEVEELETLNSMVPIWQRKKTEVSREEYDKFYEDNFMDYQPPQSVIPVSAEGLVTYKALLFIPANRPMKWGTEEFEPGLQLYSSGVMIMDKCADLLPEQFSFVRGVVESPDLSLNISRELLQHDRQLKIISNNLEKKVKGELERMLREDREGYEKFWKNFGRQLKISALDRYAAKKEALQDLLLFYSSTEKKLVTLAEYVERMQSEQKYIYYATGEQLDAVDHLPQTELLKERGIEILYFTDQVDDFLAEMFHDYKEKPFRSALGGDLDLGDEKKEADEAHKDSFDFIKETLGAKVTEVKASTILKTHPVCMSSGQGPSFEIEKYFAAVQPELGMKASRILEINTEHPAFLKFEAARITDPEKAKKYAEVFYNQALLMAGLPIEDPTAYTDLIVSLWES